MRFAALLLPLALVLSGPVAAEQSLKEQRALFKDAWERIAAREQVDLKAASEALDGYPLLPYLYWQDLRHRLGAANPDEVQQFLDRYPTLPVNGLLRSQWLHQLGRDGRWNTYLSVLGDQRSVGGATLSCYRLTALEARGEDAVDDDWIAQARRLWAVGHSQPDACDPVFAVLYDRDLLDAELRWKRVGLAMRAGNETLARALRRRLDEDQRTWLGHWLTVARDPARRLRNPDFDLYDARGREILRDGLRRLAVRDREAAMKLLERHDDERLLTDRQRLQFRRDIALRAAWARDDNALSLLDALPEAAVDDQVREWAARVALGAGNWQRLLGAIWALPLAEQSRAEWRYWKAEALRRTGSGESAAVLFSELARERNYYGFLAADAMGLPYAMNHKPTEVDESRLTALRQQTAVQRAHEFHLLGLAEEARREWLAALADMNAGDQLHAAVLALKWGWFDRAVHTANRVSQIDDLDLRFPIAWEEQFRQHADEQGVDLALAFAISRKESAFSADARSPVGALGLMQVMPGTGALVARRLGIGAPSSQSLVDPDINLRLGSAYLAQMLERFDGNLIMAAAAYNAGPGRVDGWREANAGQPAAIWIENITYGETRDYVKSVLAFRAVYDWKLNGQPRRLARSMPAMPGSGDSSPTYALHESEQGNTDEKVSN